MDITKKKKIKVNGKEYNESDFDDTRSWSKVKEPKKIKSNLPNLLGRV